MKSIHFKILALLFIGAVSVPLFGMNIAMDGKKPIIKGTFYIDSSRGLSLASPPDLKKDFGIERRNSTKIVPISIHINQIDPMKSKCRSLPYSKWYDGDHENILKKYNVNSLLWAKLFKANKVLMHNGELVSCQPICVGDVVRQDYPEFILELTLNDDHFEKNLRDSFEKFKTESNKKKEQDASDDSEKIVTELESFFKTFAVNKHPKSSPKVIKQDIEQKNIGQVTEKQKTLEEADKSEIAFAVVQVLLAAGFIGYAIYDKLPQFGQGINYLWSLFGLHTKA